MVMWPLRKSAPRMVAEKSLPLRFSVVAWPLQDDAMNHSINCTFFLAREEPKKNAAAAAHKIEACAPANVC
jgi:hypothetical protein